MRRRQWCPTPVLLPRKSHGQRSLVGCSPWGREESDTTERLHFHFSLSHIGEGNGNPLQCSCLENPRDGGAWWAAVCGFAQSRTRLKRLGSSSSMLQWRPGAANQKKKKNIYIKPTSGCQVEFKIIDNDSWKLIYTQILRSSSWYTPDYAKAYSELCSKESTFVCMRKM